MPKRRKTRYSREIYIGTKRYVFTQKEMSRGLARGEGKVKLRRKSGLYSEKYKTSR